MGEWSHDVKKPSGLCKAMLTHRDNVEKKLSQKKKKNAFWNRNFVYIAERCTSLAFETHYSLFIAHE